MYKILIGIPAMKVRSELLNEDGLIIDKDVADNEDVWTDFELNYDYDDNKYHFSFETALAFDMDNGCRNWIVNCLGKMIDYMNTHNLSVNKELDMYQVFAEGINVNTAFDDIETAFAWLKMMVFGFYGNGMYDEYLIKEDE